LLLLFSSPLAVSSPPCCSHPSLPPLSPLSFFVILFPPLPSSSFFVFLILLVVLPSSSFSPSSSFCCRPHPCCRPHSSPVGPVMSVPLFCPHTRPCPPPLPLPSFPLWLIPSVPLTSRRHAWFISSSPSPSLPVSTP
jgi:hypothetical protein